MTHFRLSRLLPRFLRGDKDKRFVDKNGEGSCTVLFLDDTELPISVKHTSKAQAILDKVFLHLNLHEKDYFGLRYVDQGGQTHWLDPNKSISSQLKALPDFYMKHKQALNSETLSDTQDPIEIHHIKTRKGRACSFPFTFYFGVKFYAADPCKLREEITRYLFFLQVKRDILQGRLPVTFDEARELCAYAVQSELGDYDPNRYTPGYISEFRFLPNQTEDLEEDLENLHKRLVGQVPAIAEYRYLEKVKWLEMYGVDLHPVLGEGSLEYFLGLTPTGIVVYKNKAKIGNYFWPRISKVTFKGKVFIIKVRDKNNDDHSYAFELQTKSACKHLWKCCVEHHAFFRLTRVPDGSNASKIFTLGSKHRYSGRTERQAQADQLTQSTSQNVLRVASRRQQRRINSDSRLNDPSKRNKSMIDGGHVTMVMQPEPVRAPRHRSLPELQAGESPRSTRSAPWENNQDGGLYTSGKDSPISARSDKMLFPRHNRAVSGSDSESGVSNRRRYFPASRKGSDGESDASTTRRRRRGEGLDSGSESDISYRYALHNRRNRNHNDIDLQNGHSDLPPMLFPFADNRKNGSIPSLHSAPGGDAKQRRRRRRSKSPGNKRPPEELKQHFEYDLIDTEGMTEDQLKDIAFVSVETKAQPFRVKLSPRTRQKAKVNRHRSFGDTDRHSNNNRDLPAPVNNRHSNQSDFRTHSHTGLPNQNLDSNLPPSGSNSYSNNYRDGRPPQSSYNRGQHVSRRNTDHENSASNELMRNVSQQNSSSNVNGRDMQRHGDRNIRDSSFQDNFDQSQSRSRDSANRHSYLTENENLEVSQHSKQSVRERYGNSHQNIPDSFYSNNSDSRHGNPNILRNSSYNTDKYNTVQNNYNPDRSRLRAGNVDQENRLSKGDNFQSPDYAVPDRSHVRSSSQLTQPQQSNNSRTRPQSAMYNSYPRNPGNAGNTNYTPQNNVSPRHARYNAPPSNLNNNNNNSQTNFNQPDRYPKHPTNRSSYPSSYNHYKPRPNPGSSIGRESGRVLSNGKLNNTDYTGQGRSPAVPYRQMNHPSTPQRNPATPPRNPSSPPRHVGNQLSSNLASPAASDKSVNRSLGSSVNSEVMAHMMRASRFNADLCTEL